MNTMKVHKIEKVLIKKGFECRDGRHRMFYFCVDGKRTPVRTMTSHGLEEYSSSLLAKMATQLKLKKGELVRLLSCPMSQEEYQRLLSDGGHI
jgi:hypothetical protein